MEVLSCHYTVFYDVEIELSPTARGAGGPLGGAAQAPEQKSPTEAYLASQLSSLSLPQQQQQKQQQQHQQLPLDNPGAFDIS